MHIIKLHSHENRRDITAYNNQTVDLIDQICTIVKSNMEDTNTLYFNFMEESSSESDHAYYIPIMIILVAYKKKLIHLNLEFGNKTDTKYLQ